MTEVASNIDDLLESLTTATRINLEDDDVALIHPRYAQYKSRRPLNQEERRRKWLIEQKEKRLDSFIVKRGIGDDEGASEDVTMAEESSTSSKKKKHRAASQYRNWLMLSYWLVDVPDNLATDWYYLLCPQGKRALVVANQGSTVAYSRKGAFIAKFPSALPGGSSDCFAGQTVLDCVFSYSTETFYVLDVLIWGIPFTDCSAEMRFFWLANKFDEHPELRERKSKNRYEFCLLRHELTVTLEQSMSTHPTFAQNEPPLDGVLFYQKDGFYTAGKSPLVVWLKPFMVRDILAVPVHEAYVRETPHKYSKMETDVAAHT